MVWYKTALIVFVWLKKFALNVGQRWIKNISFFTFSFFTTNIYIAPFLLKVLIIRCFSEWKIIKNLSLLKKYWSQIKQCVSWTRQQNTMWYCYFLRVYDKTHPLASMVFTWHWWRVLNISFVSKKKYIFEPPGLAENFFSPLLNGFVG